MIFFKIIWVIDAIAAITILYFFFSGMADGTVSGANSGLWLLIVTALVGILYGSIWLKSHGQLGLALVLLLILAIPVILFGLYFGLAILNYERWN